jgi:predicted nucleotide-binding protein (sugar kinase/HSP70/actin superfamily)
MEQKKISGPTIGIPRALLYHRYGVLWTEFWNQLGARVVVSKPTDRATLDEGSALAEAEMCLSVKTYMGHVKALIGRCDYIMVPAYTSFGIRRTMCLTFQALPDVTEAIFRNSGQKFLTCSIGPGRGSAEEGMVSMAESIGYGRKAAVRAYRAAAKKAEAAYAARVKQNEALYKKDGIRVIVAAHSYVAEDAFSGGYILEMLRKMGVTVIRADLTDRKKALARSAHFSPTMKWEMSREITGGMLNHWKEADGLLLLSVYPCAPDSMVNDMIIRKMEDCGIPILTLTLDAQNGVAGAETRLESFIDIIRMKKGMRL